MKPPSAAGNWALTIAVAAAVIGLVALVVGLAALALS